MASPLLELEGTWEEIQSHAAELAGRRVRVTVLPSAPQTDSEKPLHPRNQRMLELLAQWERTPLTEEELAILDDLERQENWASPGSE
jgi:hypothetical protein